MSEALNKIIRETREKHQASVEDFYFKTGRGDEKVRVQLLKVRETLENTIGIHVNVGRTRVVMLGERRVDRPEPGFRYHEFKTPGRAGFCQRNI